MSHPSSVPPLQPPQKAQPPLPSSFSSTRTEIETRLIRQATLDESFRQQLEQSPQVIWDKEFTGSDLANLKLRIFEDTDDTLYLVIPWHSEDFRQLLSDRPHDVWKHEFGTAQLKGFTVRVLEEPTDAFYLVLPRPEAIGDEDLEVIDTQDFEQHDTVSSPALRYLRMCRFTKWRPRNKADRILYLFQAKGVNYLKRLPIVKRLLRPIYKMRSHVYQAKRL